MLKIGLTGGIGSGKSTVAHIFAGLGIPLIDADVIAHQLSQPGQLGLIQIAETFGNEILSFDGSLDRAQLREMVFSNPAKKQQLEAILHPLIYTQMRSEIARLSTSYCVIAIPLLVETGQTDFVDRVLVIDCAVELQIERVKKRSQLPEPQICAIIASQASRVERLAEADDIIDNSKSPAHLAEQVKNLHNLYLQLSSA
jgi:dephospho-CoA kinase